MKIKISLQKATGIYVLYWVCWAAIFTPLLITHISYSLGKVFQAIGIIVCLIVIVSRVSKIKIRFNLDTGLLVLFLVWCVAITLVLTPNKLIAFVLASIIPIIQFYFIMQDEIAIKALYDVSRFYIWIQVLSMIVFTKGMFFSSIGSSVVRAQWIFGSKNNIPLYVIIFVTVILWYNEFYEQDKTNNFLYIILAGFSVVFSGSKGLEFFGGSSTGILALGSVICLVILLRLYYGEDSNKKLDGRIFLLGTLLFSGLIMSGATITFVQNIIKNILHKTITYSGRLPIWLSTIVHIKEALWLGHGEKDFFSHVRIDGILTYTSYTYNMWLKLLLNYGGMGIIILFLYLFCNRYNKQYAYILEAGMIGLMMIGLMNELDIKWLLFFPILISISCQKNKCEGKVVS